MKNLSLRLQTTGSQQRGRWASTLPACSPPPPLSPRKERSWDRRIEPFQQEERVTLCKRKEWPQQKEGAILTRGRNSLMELKEREDAKKEREDARKERLDVRKEQLDTRKERLSVRKERLSVRKERGCMRKVRCSWRRRQH